MGSSGIFWGLQWVSVDGSMVLVGSSGLFCYFLSNSVALCII